MSSLDTLNINEISNVYVMYNELCNLNYKKKDYKKVLHFFHKVSKYFDILYSNFINNKTFDQNKIESFQLGFEELKKNADTAKEQLIAQKQKLETPSDKLDEYEKILYTQKSKESAYADIAKLLYENETYVSALNFFKQAMTLNPENYANYKFLSVLYNKVNDNQRAILCLEKYKEHYPKDHLVYNAIAELYSEINMYDNFEIRIEYLKKAIELKPDYQDAIRNLAFAYRNADNIQDSLKCFQRLMQLGPTNDDYCDYAHVLLKNKDFTNGFKHFKYRFDTKKSPTPHPRLNAKEITKDIDFSDKTILVHYEQGYGDTIQFCRYLSQFKARKIIFRVQDTLVDLLTPNLENIEVVGKSTPVEELSFDYYIMLMNLPLLLGATVENIPLTCGYIKADKIKAEIYKKKYFNNNDFIANGLQIDTTLTPSPQPSPLKGEGAHCNSHSCYKIGIAWHGALEGLKNRNIPLSSFYPLAKLENVKVYSLQKGFDEDLKNVPQDIKIEDLGKTFNDFSDTAAAMENMDLIISTDNVIANLAGAMGKRTFLMLFEDTDWRWFYDKERTPWYNCVKLFRGKNRPDGINEVIQNIIEAIKTSALAIK